MLRDERCISVRPDETHILALRLIVHFQPKVSRDLARLGLRHITHRKHRAGELFLGKRVEEVRSVSYTHLRAHETRHDLVCRLLLEKKKNQDINTKKKQQIETKTKKTQKNKKKK